MFGLLPFSFRFRGRINRLLAIYHCFVDNPGVGLHPTQIAKHTGISFTDVNRRLETTPELFVRLPKRDGLTRYRLTSAASAKTEEEVEALLHRGARRETLLMYAYGSMLLMLLLIIIILIGPAL